MPKKSHKVLMIMKVVKMGWAGPGARQEQGKSRAEANQEQSRNRARTGQEQAGAELSRIELSRAERRQELVRRWAGAGKRRVRA